MRRLFFLLVLFAACNPNVIFARTTAKDSIAVSTNKKEKLSFGKTLMKPLKWFGKNWSACDPHYVVPSFYHWAGQLQNTFSQEDLSLSSGYRNLDIKMRSKLSSKIGPNFGYHWLFYGVSLDLNALKGTRRRSEFTISVNSALANIDIIRRRTGGDFTFRDFSYDSFANYDYDPVEETVYNRRINLTETFNNKDLGDVIKYGINGINMNFFLNHKKYSNPAAFSNGAIQLHSVGSPIVGIGYTHHKLTSGITDLLVDKAWESLDITGKSLESLNKLKETNLPIYKKSVSTIFEVYQGKISNSDAFIYLTNTLPTVTTIDDWHLQLGYAYNIVFSRRLLLGLSVIASPGIKRYHSTNKGSFQTLMAEELATFENKVLEDAFDNEIPEEVKAKASDFYYDERTKQFNLNIFGRAGLVYYFNRWRAGVHFNYNRFHFNHDGNMFDNSFWKANVFLGYCFGRKKEYRWNGSKRKQYVMTALTKKSIEEMRDTLPVGNIDRSKTSHIRIDNSKTAVSSNNDSTSLSTEGTATDYLAAIDRKKTKYKHDELNLNFFGSDLVKEPDGKYGYFEIEDGYVTEGQDSEGRMSKGTVLDMDKTGSIHFTCGHRNNFRTANWWKSQLTIDQTSMHWYPEMLHYALRGKLTFYLRNHMFGTREAVKVEIPDFIIGHGMDSKEFYQVGAKSMESHSTYSIIGNKVINGKLCRIYMETKKRGTVINVYINHIRTASMKWMKNLKDNMPIRRISMPGTHDAGSASLIESTIVSTSHTQNFTITEQIEDGIRAFDIRLKKDMKYGHTQKCRHGIIETMVDVRKFLKEHPTEMLVFMIGSDEGGNAWSEEMRKNFSDIITEYKDLFIEDFDGNTRLGDVRGKILVIKRQKDCPFGKLLEFKDNAIFENNGFCVEDVFKEHKTYKKIKLVQQHLRDAYENDDPHKWYITFNSISWGPQHHKPYYSAWGAVNVRKPMNKALRDVIEEKQYTNFGIVFLDFYNDHGDSPQLVLSIIKSNFDLDKEEE